MKPGYGCADAAEPICRAGIGLQRRTKKARGKMKLLWETGMSQSMQDACQGVFCLSGG
jgi:hypothetical protein